MAHEDCLCPLLIEVECLVALVQSRMDTSDTERRNVLSVERAVKSCNIFKASSRRPALAKAFPSSPTKYSTPAECLTARSKAATASFHLPRPLQAKPAMR